MEDETSGGRNVLGIDDPEISKPAEASPIGETLAARRGL
jgi:hypothetical protein